MEEVGDLIGVSRSLMADAKQTYDELLAWDAAHEPKKWGESKTKMSALMYWTSRIMDQDGESCTPGQARAGMAGSNAGAEGKTKPMPKQLELFCDGMKSLQKWGGAFTKFDDGQRKTALVQIKKTIAALPAELRQELAVEIKRLAVEAKEGK